RPPPVNGHALAWLSGLAGSPRVLRPRVGSHERPCAFLGCGERPISPAGRTAAPVSSRLVRALPARALLHARPRPEMAREAPSGFHRGGFALARSALSALPHTLSAITEMLGGLLGKPPLEGGPSHMALGSLRLPPPLWGRSV